MNKWEVKKDKNGDDIIKFTDPLEELYFLEEAVKFLQDWCLDDFKNEKSISRLKTLGELQSSIETRIKKYETDSDLRL